VGREKVHPSDGGAAAVARGKRLSVLGRGRREGFPFIMAGDSQDMPEKEYGLTTPGGGGMEKGGGGGRSLTVLESEKGGQYGNKKRIREKKG